MYHLAAYRQHQNTAISVVLNVVEPPEQLEWCLFNIRNVYPCIPIVVISDGEPCGEYESLCQTFSVRYVEGEKLKLADKGGEWWHRTLSYGLTTGTDYVIKIDPDSQFHRRVRNWPLYDISGTLCFAGSRLEHLQGGIQMFSKASVISLLDSNIFLSKQLLDPKCYAWDDGLLNYIISNNYLCSDAVLQYAKLKLKLTWGNWDDVYSHWLISPTRHRRFSITHPHKIKKFS